MNNKPISTWSLFALVVAAAAPARADVTKAQCVDANTNAQSLRREGKFSEARAMLTICGDPQCPTLVRDDCTRQLDALSQVQPTVVFDAKDPKGTDLSSVRVGVDGRRVAEKLDGTPLPVDRGEHQFSFETDGRRPVTLTLVIKEGEKERRVTVTLVDTSGAAAGGGGGGGDGGSQPHPPPPAPSTQKTLGLVAGGAGVVGLGVGTIFGIVAASKWSATRSDCSYGATCPSYGEAVSDHSATVNAATLSTIGFVAGGALLAAGVALYFTAPHMPKADSAPAVGLGPGTLTIQGHFQ
jgi:hypothetical protein